VRPRVIVDTNILFSALLRPRGQFVEVLLGSSAEFYICESVLVELFRRKEKLVSASRLTAEEVVEAYGQVLSAVRLYKEGLIATPDWDRAYALCTDVDVTDTPHVALTFALDGLLWTGDKRLRTGLEAKGFDRFFSF
jgi:predicted nucleic acid-binding protein